MSNALENHTATPLYFGLPISIIISTDPDAATDHDRLEAYSLLSLRMQASGLFLSSSHPIPPAFVENALALLRVVENDIGTASLAPRIPFHEPSTHVDVENTLSYVSEDALGTEELLQAQNRSLLAQHALQLITLMAKLPAIAAMLDGAYVESILHRALDLLSGPLPTPSTSRTQSMASLATVALVRLFPAKLAVAPVLQKVSHLIDRRITQTGDEHVVVDLLKGLSYLVARASLSPVATPVLNCLLRTIDEQLAGTEVLRVSALKSLQLSGVKRDDPVESPALVLDFFASNYRALKTAFESAIGQVLQPKGIISEPEAEFMRPPLPATRSAPRSAQRSELSRNWPLTLLASVAILTGDRLFTQPGGHAIRFIIRELDHYGKVGGRTKDCVGVWAALTWSFSCLLRREGDPAVEEKAFNIVAQQVTYGAAVELIRALLAHHEVCRHDASTAGTDGPDINLTRAFKLMKRMLGSDRGTVEEGKELFEFAIGVGRDGFAPADGHARSSLRRLLDSGRSVAEAEHPPPRLRILDGEGIVRHWAILRDVWNAWASVCHAHDEERLAVVWRRLVTAVVPTGSNRLLTNIGEDLCALLTTTRSIGSESAELVGPLRLTGILFVHRLWDILRSHMPKSKLAAVAPPLFEGVCMSFDGSKECRSLYQTLIEDGAAISQVSSLARKSSDWYRALWVLAASVWISDMDGCEPWTAWEEFLQLPLSLWTMSDYELELWGALVRRAIARARSTGSTSCIVLDSFARLMDEAKPNVGCLLALLAHLNLRELSSIPSLLFDRVNTALRDGHGSAANSGITSSLSSDHAVVLLLRSLHPILSTVPEALVVDLLRAISPGLCVWFEDETEVLNDDLYNTISMPLYCDVLDLLSSVPASPDTLELMAPLLRSSFKRSPSPAIGPLAFKDFWRAKYWPARPDCPDILKPCLRALADAFGGDVAQGLSLDTESQITDYSIVPGSQPYEQSIVPQTSSSLSGLRRVDWLPSSLPAILSSASVSPHAPTSVVRVASHGKREKAEIIKRAKPSAGVTDDSSASTKRKGRNSSTGVTEPVNILGPRSSSTTNRRQEKFHATVKEPGQRPTRWTFDGVLIPPLEHPHKRRRVVQDSAATYTETPGPRSRTPSGALPSPPTSSAPQDGSQDSEAGLSSLDARHIKRDLSSEVAEVPATDDDFDASMQSTAESAYGNAITTSMKHAALKYSQSVPTPTPPAAPSLRRARTSPAPSRPSAQLQAAYDALVNNNADVSDLVRANELVHQIGGVINKRIRRKLHSGS